MELKTIKETIEKNGKLQDVLVFKCKSESSRFVFHQYLNTYRNNNGLEVKFIEDLSAIKNTGLFTNTETCGIIYVYATTKLEELPNIKDKIVWIQCTSVKPKLKDAVIEIPSIEDWQVMDYINTNLEALEDKYKQRLYDIYKNNLFRLELEVDKLKSFPKDYKQVEDQLYVDSTSSTIFDISNCVIRRDIQGLQKLKSEIDVIDIDAFGLMKILITNFRHVIDIQLVKNSTPEYAGVTSKQFWAIKNYSCGFYTKDELMNIYKFLIELDNKIKSGKINTSLVVDYIICNIMLGGTDGKRN